MSTVVVITQPIVLLFWCIIILEASGAHGDCTMAGIGRIIEELKRLKKIDFSGYRRTMLTRRIGARMSKLGIGGYEEYLDQLRTDVSEGERLIDEIGINVSSFFRNPLVFEIISHNLLPDIIEGKGRSKSKIELSTGRPPEYFLWLSASSP